MVCLVIRRTVSMGKKQRTEQEPNAVVAEFKVSMHCNACERTVAKAISKLKGMEKFSTDMKKHKVVVTGKIDPEKVLKKLKKKTGKKVEIVVNKEEQRPKNLENVSIFYPPILDYYKHSETLIMMFSDENPNACSIM